MFKFLWQFSVLSTHTQMLLGGALSTSISQSLNATRTIAMFYPTHRLLSLKVRFYFAISSGYFPFFFLFYTRILQFGNGHVSIRWSVIQFFVFLEPSGKYQRIFVKRHCFYQGSSNQYKAIFWGYLGSCSTKQSRCWLLQCIHYSRCSSVRKLNNYTDCYFTMMLNEYWNFTS